MAAIDGRDWEKCEHVFGSLFSIYFLPRRTELIRKQIKVKCLRLRLLFCLFFFFEREKSIAYRIKCATKRESTLRMVHLIPIQLFISFTMNSYFILLSLEFSFNFNFSLVAYSNVVLRMKSKQLNCIKFYWIFHIIDFFF